MILIHIIDFFYWLYPSVVESSVTATVVSITLSHRTTENEALLRGGAATCMSSLNHDNQYFSGFAPIFPDICYHLPHYKPAAADIPVASDNPAHYADAIRYNARTPLQGSLLPLTRLVWA